MAAARLREGQKISLDIVELARRTGMALHEIEPSLLGWRDDGLLGYRGSGRTMSIELCGPSKTAKAELEEMLRTYKIEAGRKIQKLAAYAKGSGCRHDIIARHFGEEPVTGCRSCDNCLKAGAPVKMTDSHNLILKGVICLPIRLDAKGLMRALMGARSCPIRPHEWPQLAAFREQPEEHVKTMIDDLIDWGYLERDGTPLRPLLQLTMAGRKLAAGEETEQ